ncbi:hypothetical protein ABL78_4435 [Leptomonas seymouri]|uniref:Uncharacterized protein n=1 Tax=Leptomonas seymouri TaxID=5684 RepID=A0A0N1IK89_LEPSE|nr:hypothetical protein ABL78_4435 [Leptomonas seymouri]|eukprot:KPI86495.1 hypothetical protein ABL78_4435 [Leptomonas seymouri]
MESLTLWNDVSSNLAEFVFDNWLMLVGAALLLLSCVKHSLMYWEFRQDRRRLECCHIRHCALLHAAQKHKRQHLGVTGDSEKVKRTEGADEAVYARGDAAAALTNTSRGTTPAGAGDLVVPEARLNSPNAAAATTKVASRKPSGAIHDQPRPRHPSDFNAPPTQLANDAKTYTELQSPGLPITSSSSDLSLSISPISVTQQADVATSRLLNRVAISPHSTEAASGIQPEGSAKIPFSVSGEVTSRRSVCCPRYSEDEQRRIDEKRQANAQAWMEAKRALESTENWASCGLTPMSSTTRRKISSDSGAACKE